MIPTKKRGVDPKEVTFALPARSVAPSALVDEKAEAVKQKAARRKAGRERDAADVRS